MIRELDRLDENRCLTRAEKIRLAVAQYIEQNKQKAEEAA
jgi:metal-responsive CopG/Arc/MetJ family transcriptional regulator